MWQFWWFTFYVEEVEEEEEELPAAAATGAEVLNIILCIVGLISHFVQLEHKNAIKLNDWGFARGEGGWEGGRWLERG